jgi:Fe-S oxidoreductase
MQIENVIATAENCRYCLMCRHVTPIGIVTHRETLTPHGFGLLIASVQRGLMEWDEGAVDALYSASDGGNSRAHCVTDQPLPEAIAAVRAELVAQQRAPAVVYQLQEAFEKWGTPFAELAPRPVEGQGTIGLFVGDEAPYLWSEALVAARRLLQAIGIDPVLIGMGRNNGYLASSLGLPDQARKLALVTLEELKTAGVGRLLVLSAGDYFTFHQLYDERLGIPWPEEVEIIELTAFLVEQVEAGTLRFKQSADTQAYAYVDPTHAVRVPARHGTPRKLLEAALPGERYELFWRQDRAHPVGSTALQFTKPEISEKLTRARLVDAQSSGARLLVCEDPGTLAQLALYAEEYGLHVRCLYDVLAAGLES